MGRLSLSGLEAATQGDTELVRLDQLGNGMRVLTDRTNLAQEQQSVALVNSTVGTQRPINHAFVPFPDLIEREGAWLRIDAERGVTEDYTEQREAVEAMLKANDQVFALRGLAGAGKTTALKE